VRTLTYQFKLKPTVAQVTILEDWLEQCRRVYNWALAERKDWFKSRSCQINACSIRAEYIIPASVPRRTYASQCKGLTQARATIPALNAVQVHVLQQTLKRLEPALVNMWKQKHGFPRFKKVGAMRSFVFPHIVSGCIGMIKSRSIIPHSPTDDSRLPTPHHSGVTGIDIRWD
jgi:putative transposase